MNTNLTKIARETIEIEINELISLKNNINTSFEKAIHLILKSKGKLVVVGIGKSAHIGNKLVATLNSTGTPSQFLHAAEAIHGDLGLLQKEDIVICISNSGNSPEIKNLVSILKDNSAGLIAITGNKNSSLANFAEVVLNYDIKNEACPINLAPTSSTTVQLVICDTIAVALMKSKNFEAQHFAKFHPGGSLGKNLLTKVKHLTKSVEKPSISINDSIKEVILSLSSTSFGITAVLENDKIEGVITDGDLRRMLLKNKDFLNLTAKDIMSEMPKTIEKEEMASTALSIMKNYDIGQLIVVDNGLYFGIVDIHQLIEEGIKS